MLGNRFMLWASRNQAERMLADLTKLVELTREIGNPRTEYSAHQLMALCFHWFGRSAEAEAHIRRAIEVDDRQMGDAAHLEGRLLLARILAVRGDLDATAAVLAEIRAHEERARASGQQAATLLPAEAALFNVVELVVRGGTREQWWEAVELARNFHTSHDLEEVERLASAHPPTFSIGARCVFSRQNARSLRRSGRAWSVSISPRRGSPNGWAPAGR